MIRTKEQLIDCIAAERSWRIMEIVELRRIVEMQSMSPTRRRVVCRAGVAILYAHWEGFVKKTGTYFLEYVASQRLKLRELRGNFITIALRSRIDEATKSRKYSAFDKIADYIRNNQDTRALVPYKNIVDTESNLSTRALKEIAWCLGIDYSVFATKEKLIDSRLLARRNHVAHGELLEVEAEDFSELADNVVALIDAFRAQIENAAVTESYKTAA